MRFVKLSEEEKYRLEDLYKNSTDHVVREGCQCLLLSNQGHSMAALSRLLSINWLNIVRLFNAWESSEDKYSTLSIAPGRGAKVKLEPVRDYCPTWLKSIAVT